MNILTKTFGGRIVCRPDTTWEKDNADFYPPQFVEALTYAPVFFAHILKPGRSVQKKFAGRYFDGIGFGILLYPQNIMDGSPEGYAEALCLDKTSYLPAPCISPAEYSSLPSETEFILKKNEHILFRCAIPPLSMVEDAIVQASRLAYIRTGDAVAIELAARSPLMQKSELRDTIASGQVGSGGKLDFSIIF
ncbi:MAG: hypothetical protein PUK70_02820 [Bacteroidales bacterium]|nr:hypothetical protein [Bacteroidales bacterium]MDY6001999.1 hypothetical protein [Candidatus Cryptobacteroides sp.]